MAVKREGKSTTSMFSKTNRDKIVNNGIVRGVGDSEIVKSIEGELETNLKGNEHKILAGTLKGMANLKQEYGANDAILLSKIKSVEDNTKSKIKAYKFDFINNVDRRSRTYHIVESVNELNAGIKGTSSSKPKILPGDVITYKTGETGENGIAITKTVIWTGQATGFL